MDTETVSGFEVHDDIHTIAASAKRKYRFIKTRLYGKNSIYYNSKLFEFKYICHMKKTILFTIISMALVCACSPKAEQQQSDREFWVETLDKIARPVLSNLANGTLTQNMPYESLGKTNLGVSRLEAFGRTMVGISPWLELGPDDSPEGKLRAEYIDMALKALANSVDPDSPDYLVYNRRNDSSQPLVDAAFLAEGLLRAPTQLWGRLDAKARENLVREMKSSREIKPFESNWLLFASAVEAFLLEVTGECDMERMEYGIKRFMEDGWYKGDALYGDGPNFHFDYYNSLVIHPMLTDVLAVMKKHGFERGKYYEEQIKRLSRYAVQLERMISPEGTYPAVGRSITYRFGHFHVLAQASLLGVLPEKLPAPQVRSALTAVIRNQISVPGTFDENGWLTVGFAGHQINMSESYINTGSEYLCCAVFLPLGLPETDPFWSGEFQPWTNLKAWRGEDVGSDHAL